MAAVLTADAFLDVIRRSRLISADDLQNVLSELEDDGADVTGPKGIAQALIDREKLTRWQADYLLQGKHKGFFLGSYRFLKMLGKGGMGAVYLAQHEMMRRHCAIKVLPSKMLKDRSSVLERFYLEAQAVASLDHPNIVRAYDVNKEIQGKSEIHYLVMEYVEGKELQTLVHEKGSGLDYVDVADYARQAAYGLAHAHENGLIHRDIKPANLLVDTKGVVKILDLGLARFFDDPDDASLTAAYNESILGTADYLSPEQALNSHEVDTRTDIYSLGCTCYFMLTGQPPFPEGTVAQRLISHQIRSPKPLEKTRPDVPTALVAIIERMIAKKPVDRFQSASEVGEAFRAWLIENADDTWRQRHRDVFGDGSGATLSSPHEPTRGTGSALDDTELGLAPLEDKEEAAAASDSGVSSSSGTDLETKTVAATATASSASPDLEPLDETESSQATQGIAATAQVDPLEQPLDNLLNQSLDDLSGDQIPDLGPSSGINVAGSGIHQRQPVAVQETHDHKQLLWLILIGLGVSIPLAAVILFVSLYGFGPGRTPAIQRGPETAALDPDEPEEKPEQTGEELPNGQGTSAQEPGETTSSVPTETVAAVTPQEQHGNGRVQIPAAEPDTGSAGQPKEGPASDPPGGTGPSSTPPAAVEQSGNAKPVVTPPKDNGATEKDGPGKKKVELTPEERRKLFATIRNVAVKLEHSTKNTKIDALLVRSAYDAFIDAGIRAKIGTEDSDPTVLRVALSGDRDGSRMVAILTAEITHRIPDSDSDPAVVWRKSEPIATLTPQALRAGKVPAVLRDNVGKFYNMMMRDHRAAVDDNR